MGWEAAAKRPPEPSVVPVSVAEADRLHTLAHRAANRVRTIEDWWETPLTTSLAAVTRARHSSAYRDEAERAVSRLLRWWRDEVRRPISRDVVALALTARGAADLQRREPELVHAAAEAVEGLAQRDPTIVPTLHLALSAWALDTLVPDRNDQPWPELRKRLGERGSGGVEEPLRQYVAAVAARQFDANGLVQSLLGAIGTAPSSSDACVLLWVITVAAERLAQSLAHDDNALRVLLQRRASLVERLVGDVDDQTFLTPELEEFGEPIPDDLPVISYLSPFEALLLDFVLAPRDEADAWLTYPEAEALFGAQAADARDELERATDRHLRSSGGLATALGFSVGAVTWLGLVDLDWKRSVAASLAVMVTAIAIGTAALLGRTGGLPEKLMEVVGTLFFATAAVAAVNAYNQHRTQPFISDVTGLVVGLLLPVLAALAWIGGSRLLKSRCDRRAGLIDSARKR